VGLDEGNACDNTTDSYEKHTGWLAPKHMASQMNASSIMYLR